MKIGQTQDLVVNADMSKFSDRVVIKEGINTHRVLRGPFLMRSVYWPTLILDQGQYNQRMKSVLVPKTGSTLLRSLSDTEKEFRRTQGESDPRSQFTPSNTYMYLILNRDEVKAEDELPVVRVAAYKQTIYNRLEEIQSEKSTKDKTKLKNGLIFMYDVQIKKTVGDAAKPRYTTKYTVDVDSENNKVQGVMPIELHEMPVDKMMEVLTNNNIWKSIFTEQELAAIDACEIDLGTETNPNNEEEILHKLKENPIFLGAKDGNSGQFLFPQNEQFMKFLKSKELPILESAAQAQQLAEGKTDTPAETTKAEAAPINVTTDATFETTPAETTIEVKPEEVKTVEVATDSKPTEVTPEGGKDTIKRWGDQK